LFSIAISERFKYKQNWRQGEKAGKVIILRDIHTVNTHAGHERILLDLVKPVGVNNYDQLHQHWLQVLDVNILNKKFFQDLANWYFWAMDNVSFPDDLEKKKDVRNATNLIRLITRVVFIWFIKEKSLVPNSLFNKAYLDKILKDFNKNKKSQNYYHAILQNLFFGTLNQKMDERKFAKDGGNIKINNAEFGVKNLFRYADLFSITEKEAMLLFKDVPFLNGGLFDCLDKPNEDGKVVYVDGFSRNPKKQASVPDYIFFGEEREVDLNEIFATKNKKYKSRGLINLLESYKFTVAENTPIEEEIALDPELLGKVFENLLASYNPETQTTARKQTGSFYTPREIVNYMVDESLLEYIKQNVNNETDDFETRLRDLISYSETPNPFDETETKALIEAINNCKILDPACGSGAYPMGILHKMVHLLQKLDVGNILWKAQQRENIIGEQIRLLEKDREAIKGLSDKAVRAKAEKAVENRLNEVEEIFESENNFDDYARKLYLIENCIYGIDIQPIAVQISKLRFFISLIIDQNKQEKKENFGIRSLPNLETKFVAANTLIGLDKPAQTLLRNPQIEEKETELKELRHKYFTANTRKEKLQYQKQDKKLRQEIAKMLESDGWQTAVAKQIVAFDPYDQNTFAPWFDPEWMFGLTCGFDIVIGNPPYIGHKGGLKEMFRDLKSTPLGKRFNNERMDIFYYFFHASLDFANNNGIVSFITTNYFLTADSAIKLRRDFKTRAKLFKMLNFNELKVFESAMGQHNIVTFLTKNQSVDKCDIINISRVGAVDFDILERILLNDDDKTTYYTIETDKLYDSDNNYIRLNYGNAASIDSNHLILDKLRIGKKLLGEYCFISQGIVTGLDRIGPKHILRHPEFEDYKGCGIYVLSSDEKKQIGKSNLLKPWFKNSDINRYFVNDIPEKWLIHTSTEINLKDFENISNHLNFFKKLILERNYESGELSKAKRLKRWWALSSSRWEYDFDKPKILSPQRSYTNAFAYTEKSWYASADVYFISDKLGEIPLKYFLGLLNTKLIYFWLYNRGKRKGDMLELYLTPLSEIPIPKPTSIVANKIVHLVGFITSLKKVKNDSNFFERIMDAMVYELYLPEEIKAGGAEVLKHLTNLPELKEGQDDKNLKTIEKVYKELSDPKHPISAALLKLLTIEEVNIIEGRK